MTRLRIMMLIVLIPIGIFHTPNKSFCQNWPHFFPARFQYPAGVDPLFVAAGDFNEDSFPDIAVADGDGDQIAVLIGMGNGSYTDASFFPVGYGPNALTIGDFNEDSHLDIAITIGGDGDVAILFGDGAGQFLGPSIIDVGDGPNAIDPGDFNEDSHLDLVVTKGGTDEVAILLGDGAGSFPTINLFHTGDYPRAVTAGDFNEDSHLDLAVAHYTGGNMAILLGAGDGTFSSPNLYFAGYSQVAIEVGDFNDDGHRDLAIGEEGNNSFATFLGSGNGSFTGPTFHDMGDSGESIAIGDFDEDGHQDVAIVGDYYSEIGFRIVTSLGDGTGNFSDPTFLSVGSYPNSLAIGDVDNDGHEDLVLASGIDYHRENASVSVLLGSGTGSFANADFIQTWYNPRRIVVEDFDEDGNLDIAVATLGITQYYVDGVISIQLGTGTGSFVSNQNANGGPQPNHIVSGDFDEDGHRDLASVSQGETSERGVYILIGDGTGSFSRDFFYSTTGTLGDIDISDFNEDNHQDLVVIELNSGDLYILQGDGTGAFSFTDIIDTGFNPGQIEIGDFNEDNHQDLAVTKGGTEGIAIFLGSGTGSFSAPVFHLTGGSGGSLTTGDFNEDGHEDLAVSCADLESTAILLGTGDGGFSDPTYCGHDGFLVAGNFSRDDHLDLAIVRDYDDDVAVVTGTGTGVFSDPVRYGTGDNPKSAAIGDFNEDGRDDLAVPNIGSFASYEPSKSVFILLNHLIEIDVEIDSPVNSISPGEMLPYTVTITNPTDSLVTFDLSLFAKAIGGSEILLLGPRRLSLPGGGGFTRETSLLVPGNTPPRQFIVTLKAESTSGELIDEDSFRVRVLP